MTKAAEVRKAWKKDFSDNGWVLEARHGACCWLKGLGGIVKREMTDFHRVSSGRRFMRPPWTLAVEGLKKYLQGLGIWSPEQREQSGQLRPVCPFRWVSMVFDDDGNHIGFEEGPPR